MISSLDVRRSHGVWESWPALLGAREPSGPLADPFPKELRKLSNPRVITGIVNVYQLECAKLVYSLYISSLNPHKTHRGSAILSPVVQIRKLRLREVRLTQLANVRTGI